MLPGTMTINDDHNDDEGKRFRGEMVGKLNRLILRCTHQLGFGVELRVGVRVRG